MRPWIPLSLVLGALGCTSLDALRLVRDPASKVIRTEERVRARADGSVRFFAVGDAGSRDERGGMRASTVAVAALVEQVCGARGGCDFGVFLGDNVYWAGIEDEADARFFRDFTALYRARPERPLYFVLGNHDYDPIVAQSSRAASQLDAIAALSGRGVRGRAQFYGFEAGPLFLTAWDTNALVRGCEHPFGPPNCGIQGVWELSELARSKQPFRIWLGHHPYRSNGEHGDAGWFLDAGLMLWEGSGLAHLLERFIVGHADLMLSGHDHNLQAFVGLGGGRTAAVVSGAGSKTTPLAPPSRRNPSAFEQDGALGFALVEAGPTELAVSLFARDADLGAPCDRTCTEPRFEMVKRVDEAWRVVTPGAAELSAACR